MSDALMTVHAKHPFPDTPEEIAAVARAGARPELPRAGLGAGLHVYNRDGLRLGQGAFELWPQLEAARTTRRMRSTWAWNLRAPRSPGSSASATCRTSRWTGAAPSRRRRRSERLVRTGHDDGGTRRRVRHDDWHPATRHELTMNDQIFETVLTTVAPDGRGACGADGRALRRAGQVVLMPFKPSTTLDNVVGHRRMPC